jgi:hypothetical protein
MSQPVSPQSFRRPVWLLAGFWLCVTIAIATVVRRLIVLMHPSQEGASGLASLNAAFSSHALLTTLHIIPAAGFVLVSAPVLLCDSSSAWLETLFFVLGIFTGITAFAMSSYAIGGWVEISAVIVFNSWFLLSLALAYSSRLRHRTSQRREWQTRAVGVLLGIATTRPVMGLFFATSSRTHLAPSQFFGIAFWIGFSLNVAVTEFWLHSKRRADLQ